MNKAKRLAVAKKLLCRKDGKLLDRMGSFVAGAMREKMRPVETTGSGWYTGYNDRRSEWTAILRKLGYKYKQGNDAPRGGAAGAYIQISKPARIFFKKLWRSGGVFEKTKKVAQICVYTTGSDYSVLDSRYSRAVSAGYKSKKAAKIGLDKWKKKAFSKAHVTYTFKSIKGRTKTKFYVLDVYVTTL